MNRLISLLSVSLQLRSATTCAGAALRSAICPSIVASTGDRNLHDLFYRDDVFRELDITTLCDVAIALMLRKLQCWLNKTRPIGDNKLLFNVTYLEVTFCLSCRQIEDAAFEANPMQSLRTLRDSDMFLSVIYCHVCFWHGRICLFSLL